MNIIMDLVTNRILVATVAAWFVAQFLKVLFDTIKNGFSVERLTGSGGMPSSHSATVTGLVVSTAIVEGVGGFPFVMAMEGKQPLNEKPLREKMGHTIPEIIVGMALGGTVAAITCILMQKLI